MEKQQYIGNEKTHKSMIYGLSLAFFAHFIFFVIFLSYEITPLVHLNIVSIFLYLILLWLVSMNQIILAMVGASLELIIHQIMVVHYIGWGYGFEYFLLVVPSFVLLGVFKNRLIPLLFTFLSIASLILLKLYSLNLDPLYSLANVKQNIVLMNLLFTALPIAFFTGLFASSSFRREKDLLNAHKELYYAATFDPLTGLHNRSQGVQKLRDFYLESLEGKKPYVLAVLDIDNFKRINDDFGHAVGDKVLEKVALILKQSLRDQDWVFRWGGEEFLLLFPQMGLNESRELLKNIQKSLAQTPIQIDDNELLVTVTVGFVESNLRKNEQLIKLADQALYQGKEAGKNCLVPALQ